MAPANYQILPYSPGYQQQVDDLIASIQAEFPESIAASVSGNLNELYLNKNEWYWIAVVDGTVVGTAGLHDLDNDMVALKWMMLAREYRGKDKGIAVALLNTVIRAARQQNNEAVFLGIMDQFKAAEKFFSRNGFQQISEDDLPKDFASRTPGSLYYKRSL